MRGSLRAIGLFGLFVALVTVGCHHDKYNLNTKFPEEYIDPPHQKRFDEPETAPYRKPPPPKDDKSKTNGPGNMGTPGGPGGFGGF